MLFLSKIVISGILIAYTSWLAGRKPFLAGFIVALPLTSMLSILFSYLEYRNLEKMNQFAVSVLVAVPLSLAFFIPFLLNKWLKMNFILTYASAVGCLVVAYFIHHAVFKSDLFR